MYQVLGEIACKLQARFLISTFKFYISVLYVLLSIDWMERRVWVRECACFDNGSQWKCVLVRFE